MARANLGKKLLLGSGTLVVAFVLADLGVRCWGPPVEYSGAGYALAPNGERVPASEIYNFLYRDGHISNEGDGPRGRLHPGQRTRFGYEQPRWSYYDRDGSYEVAINALGFRDDEFAREKPAGEWRALALGDSFTYGMGVPAALNWPTVLERELAAARGGPVQVINAGMACGKGARTAAQYAPWFEQEGVAFAPDLVLLGFCLNDFGDLVPMLAYDVPKYEPFLGGSIRLLDLIHRRLQLREWRQQKMDAAAIDAKVDEKLWADVQDGMRRIQRACEARKVPFVVVVFPMLSQLDGDYPYVHLHERVAAFCAQEHIRSLDLLSVFRGKIDDDLWVHPTDQHPNDVGHRMIADAVFAYLRAQQLLPQKK